MSPCPGEASAAQGPLAAVPRRVDSRDVLDPNASVRQSFTARQIGFFRRLGPNAWDDYELVAAAGATIRVPLGLKIQVEAAGVVFRMRHDGQVVVLEWLPSDEDRQQIGADPPTARLQFVSIYLKDYASPPGFGLAAVIAKKLKERE